MEDETLYQLIKEFRALGKAFILLEADFLNVHEFGFR
jgi:hypothetical protein